MTVQKTRSDKLPDADKAASTENTEALPKQTIGAFVAELLVDPTLGYEEIIELVLADFPQANTSTRSVASTASVLRRKGFDIPIRKRAPSTK